MGFDLCSPIVLDIQIWDSFDPILEWHQSEGLGMGHNIPILKSWFQKCITNLEKTIVIEFDFFYYSWNIVYKFGPLLAQLWLFDVTRIVKFPNFWKMKEDKIFHFIEYAWFQV